MQPSSQLGKRHAEAVGGSSPQPHSQSSASSVRHAWKRRYTRLTDWPPDWQAQYAKWKALPDLAERRNFWLTCDKPLQDQVWSATTTAMRSEIKEWMAEAECAFSQGSTNSGRPKPRGTKKKQRPSTPNAQPPFPFENVEKQSHDWQEGARIGEAANPGPKPGQNQGTAKPTPNPPHNPSPQTSNARELARGYQYPGPTGPRRPEKREPGHPEEAQQAPRESRPYRKRQNKAQNNE